MTIVERERVVVAPVVPARVDELLDILVNARALLAKGWCQGDYRGGEAVCMIGALLYSNGMGFEEDEEFEVELIYGAEKALQEVVGDPSGLISWNDTPGRTQGEALAAYDEAIRRRRAEL